MFCFSMKKSWKKTSPLHMGKESITLALINCQHQRAQTLEQTTLSNVWFKHFSLATLHQIRR